MATGYKFPILNSDGTASGSKVDMEDMFVPKDQFLTAGLWGWGRNFTGQLGNGSINVSYSSPIQIGSLTNWKQVSCVGVSTLSIKTDGTLWSFGYNANGELGIGSTLDSSSPVQVGLLSNWKLASSALLENSAAIKTDGTLWAWGRNIYGTVGNGTTISYSSPIQIGLLTNWKQISIGYNHSTSVKTDGTLWGWGRNDYGQLGNGNTINYSSPIQIGSLTNWKQVSCGYHHVSAIKTDGTLWTWGSNIDTSSLIGTGQLGNGTTIKYSSPIQIGSLTNWKQVSSGKFMTSGVKTDGTLWTWGDGYQGELGNGNTINYSSPIQIGSLTNWKQVSCGYRVTAAVKTDGTLWTWGQSSNYGRLGNGNTISYSSPIQIGSLTSWKQVSAINHVIGIFSPDYYYNQ